MTRKRKVQRKKRRRTPLEIVTCLSETTACCPPPRQLSIQSGRNTHNPSPPQENYKKGIPTDCQNITSSQYLSEKTYLVKKTTRYWSTSTGCVKIGVLGINQLPESQAAGSQSSNEMTSRPLYVPHVGQTRWGRLGLWHCGQTFTDGSLSASCARRLSLRACEVFRFGTAMDQIPFLTKDVGYQIFGQNAKPKYRHFAESHPANPFLSKR